jgi:Ser/Thr protein kinase RdoA (MazF antagonist)
MSTNLSEAAAQAANAFGLKNPLVEPVSQGLIHHTFKAESANGSCLIQKINTQVFTRPEVIVQNYLAIYNHLSKKQLFLPQPIKTISEEYLYFDKSGVWRATAYVAEAGPLSKPLAREHAYAAAACFAQYSAALRDLKTYMLTPAIPEFHNLQIRFHQFEEACRNDNAGRLKKLKQVADQLLKRNHYVQLFNSLQHDDGVPLRLMHCDCKISNLLFSQNTLTPICPVDWDTAMPGYFFSDIGDLIRTATPTLPESDWRVEELDIRKDIYEAIIQAFAAFSDFTPREKELIHCAGLLMTYMQTLRFATDYLNGDVYYATAYPEQNYHRTANQLTLLKKLEAFTEEMTP